MLDTITKITNIALDNQDKDNCTIIFVFDDGLRYVLPFKSNDNRVQVANMLRNISDAMVRMETAGVTKH